MNIVQVVQNYIKEYIKKIAVAIINCYIYISKFRYGFPWQKLKISCLILKNGGQINSLWYHGNGGTFDKIFLFIIIAMYTPHTKKIMEIYGVKWLTFSVLTESPYYISQIVPWESVFNDGGHFSSSRFSWNSVSITTFENVCISHTVGVSY